jgi:hypothetical protein
LKRLFFFIGFFLGIAFFVAANMYAYHVAEPPCCDFSIAFGFPFPLGRTGGFAGGTNLIVLGVVLNSLIGLGASFIFALLFARLLPWLVDLFRQAGQWHMKTRS